MAMPSASMAAKCRIDPANDKMEACEMPDVFVQFCQWFHQDVLVLYRSLDNAILGFVAELDDPSKVALKTYLSNLIASGASDEELLRLWKRHGAEIGFVETSSI